MAEPVTMDILVRLARVNGDLIREQKTATDTANVIARLIEGADVVFAVWANNPADPDPNQFEVVSIRSTPAWSEHRRQGHRHWRQ
jgi:hypothetical protein